MQPKDILNEIIHAEHAAQGIYNEALRSQADFDAVLQRRSDELREEYYAEADSETAEYEAAAVKASEEALAELEQELKAELEHVRALYESRRDDIVERLFERVVGADD